MNTFSTVISLVLVNAVCNILTINFRLIHDAIYTIRREHLKGIWKYINQTVSAHCVVI